MNLANTWFYPTLGHHSLFTIGFPTNPEINCVFTMFFYVIIIAVTWTELTCDENCL